MTRISGVPGSDFWKGLSPKPKNSRLRSEKSFSFFLPLPRGADDVVEAKARLPSKRLRRLTGIGDKTRGIPGPPRTHAHLYFFPSDTLDSAQDLLHGIAVAVSQIEDPAFQAAKKRLERQKMRRGQVLDVNVIANAGAVRRVVVVAEDHELFVLSGDGAKDVGNDVRFGLMALAGLPSRMRAAGVEITQGHE